MASIKEKINCILWLAELQCAADVRKQFLIHYNKEAPPSNSIYEWMKTFKKSGSVIDKPYNKSSKLIDDIETTITEDEQSRKVSHLSDKAQKMSAKRMRDQNDGLSGRININEESECQNFLQGDGFPIKIKQELPDEDYCFVSNGIVDTLCENLPGCSNSELETGQPPDTAPVKLESVKEEEESNHEMAVADLPVKCQIEEPFMCEHCSFSTWYERKFKKHVAVHYLQKRFSCHLCPFITKHRGDLISHLLTHTKIKRLTCEFCPFQSRTKGEFREHTLTHTQPFRCQVCLYETNSESLLSSHMLTCCVLMRPKRART